MSELIVKGEGAEAQGSISLGTVVEAWVRFWRRLGREEHSFSLPLWGWGIWWLTSITRHICPGLNAPGGRSKGRDKELSISPGRQEMPIPNDNTNSWHYQGLVHESRAKRSACVNSFNLCPNPTMYAYFKDVMSTLKMNKLRFRESKGLAQGHTSSKW